MRLRSARLRSAADRCESGSPFVVVCAVDDARADKAIVLLAADVVRRCGGRLVLLHTQPPPLIYAAPQVAYAAQQKPQPARDLVATARELARLAAAADVAPTSEVRVGFGDLEKRLLATARDEQAALLVIGSRAGGDRAMRLLGEAPCPVVVVPSPTQGATASARSGWGRKRMAFACASGNAASMSSPDGGDVTSSILCGVDASHHARLALRHASRLADVLGIRLVVAHVVQPPLPAPRLGPTAGELTGMPIDALLAGGEAMLEELLDREGLDHVERRVMLGFPADRLADLADEEPAELIVVGSRGRGALKAALLGSVSTDVIAVARCPVVVVPPRVESPSCEDAQTAAASVARAA